MENTTQLQILEDVKKEVAEIVEIANSIAVITNDSGFRKAAEFRKSINTQKKALIEKCQPLVSATYFAWKESLRLRDEAISPIDEAISILDSPITAWSREQERLRKVEEEKRTAEARKQAEEDQLARAEEAQKSGDFERSEAILNQTIAPPPVIMPRPEKVEGVSIVTYYGVMEPVDIRRLATAALAGDVPLEAIIPDMVFLRKIATATKGSVKYPGVTFTARDSVRSVDGRLR